MFTKRIFNEIRKFNELDADDDRKKKITFKINEEDMKEVYFVIHNLDKPFIGYYLGKIELPERYPHKPPGFKFITPNGRFDTNGKICTTFSNFHKESWSPAWNVYDMIYGLITMMNESAKGIEGGVGGIEIPFNDRLKLAKESIKFNLNHKIFIKYFSDLEMIPRNVDEESGKDPKE